MGEVMLSNSVPPGGNTGDVLTKNSGQNYDVTWKEPDTPTTPIGGGIPSGGIIIWSGASNAIPDGWALCDGQNGRPDLRGRFVLGAGNTYTVGETGGEKTHKLTVAEMPSHFHEVKYSEYNSNFENQYYEAYAGLKKLESMTIMTRPSGNDQPHNNMPPYYVLCYIMKL